MPRNALAIDLGASGGRAILGSFDGERITLTELHRFENNPVELRGTLYWDVLRLFHEIRTGMSQARKNGSFDTVGIDTWGVDFGLFNRHGELIQNPVHYRDKRTQGMMDEVLNIIGRDELYKATGIQIMEINTLFQMYWLAKNRPELLENSAALLTPDLFGYLLTGNYVSEYSIASTTQMMNPYTYKWNTDIMSRLGIPQNIFPEIAEPGQALGNVLPSIAEETGAASVVSITGHDTACAVAATPASDKDFIYISCGTWSLFGTETDAPVINDKSIRHNMTNEGGYGYKTRFLKNIIGLWVIQEARRQYKREGKDYSYADLERFALSAKQLRFFIDPDAPEFGVPGNMPERICDYCRKTGQGTPETVGEIMRCIYESLAMKYRMAFDQIKDCTGKSYSRIHMIGGGTKDNLLCRMTANATNLPVSAGPIEATALGNIAVQLMSVKELANLSEARAVISKSTEPVIYEPSDSEIWNEAYERFFKVVQKV